ncbi:MAG TPA: hypothetical protein VJT75_11805 [Thermoleophilaceae bacterium]|nr:hypothetical protein [Thermoleophilaceae bacterium]
MSKRKEVEEVPNKRIRIKGIRREQIDTDKLALAYWLMAKRAVEEKRRREAEDKKERRSPKAARKELDRAER